MGICSSCDAAVPVATAKVILHDGRLQEYAYPVKVSYVLQRIAVADAPDFFVCNSDEMEFDGVVSAVDEDEDLQPGQLYFALPLTNLRRPLLTEEMAALAVKANAALIKGSAGNDKCRHRSNLLFTEKDLKSTEVKAAVRKGRRSGGGGRRSKSKDFAAKLSAIPE